MYNKYNSEGNESWNRVYEGGHLDTGNSVAVDSQDNIIVTGSRRLGGDNQIFDDYYTTKCHEYRFGIFLCSDCNSDEQVDIADILYLINYLFIGGPAPVPLECIGGCNVDDAVNLGDVVYLVNYLFKVGPEPGGCCE